MKHCLLIVLLALAAAVPVFAQEERVAAGGIVVTADNLPMIAIARPQVLEGTQPEDVIDLLICETADCSSFAVRTLGRTMTLQSTPRLALNADGSPVIAHFNGEPQSLLFHVCEAVECADPYTFICDVAGCVNAFTRITGESEAEESIFGAGWGHSLAADGAPAFAYYENGMGSLRVTYCIDLICSEIYSSDPDFALADGFPGLGQVTSLVVGMDGRFYVAYVNSETDSLRFLTCSPETYCQDAAPVDIYAGALYPTLALREGGLPAMLFFDSERSTLKLALCDDAGCGGGVRIIDVNDNALPTGVPPLLLIDGIPAAIYPQGEPPALQMTRCVDDRCHQLETVVLDESPYSGYNLMATLDANGAPVVFYHNPTLGDEYRLLRCESPACDRVGITEIADWRE